MPSTIDTVLKEFRETLKNQGMDNGSFGQYGLDEQDIDFLESYIEEISKSSLEHFAQVVEKLKLEGFHGSKSRDNQEDKLRLEMYNKAINDVLALLRPKQ